MQAREVLQLFSHYNPYVGYCQGMNTIIAFLLSRGFSCQESFFYFQARHRGTPALRLLLQHG